MSYCYDFFCYACGTACAAGDNFFCPGCGDPLSVRAQATPAPGLFRDSPRDLWHYQDLLPIASWEHVVTLGEGATPLLAAPRLSAHSGCRVDLKNEAANPTGAFKDRQISVGISHAREIGKSTVAVVSSGNVACATAAYAARAGMRAVLFMHAHAAPEKIRQCAVYGAKVICVNSPAPSKVFELCLEACAKFGWYHLSTAGMYEPFNVEGAKTIAYELYQQYDGDLPEWIVAPVGGGGLLGAIWRGFLDLQRLGLIEKPPRLAGAQAEGCALLKQCIAEGWSFQEHLKHPWPDPETIAGGIADDILFDGHTVLPAIRETDGAAIAVSENAIRQAILRLASTEGMFVEPSCAVTVAALEQLPGVRPETGVCCVLTGSGFKDPGAVRGLLPEPARVGLNLGEVEAAL
ncbi:MAG: threonine synthase [Candidatus Hydrogenedentes bacterium]|nr:threonine synthase [Candidatus Hydrogenedentota bacterium]